MYYKNKRAFTLVEVLIAMTVLSLFLGGVYKLFIGGSKTADKGQWINTTVDQMRNALNIISQEVRSSTYPTTMFSDTIYDPCDNPDKSIAAQYYMRILKDGEPITVPESGREKIMSWCVCSAEKPGTESGKIVKHELYLAFKNKIKENIFGDLILKTSSYNYTTSSSNNYARSGKLSLTEIPDESRSKVLVNDVKSVEFAVAGTVPPQKAVDFFPISVKICTLYPKDTKVTKDNSVMATPQVAIDLLGSE